jgi:hypothetical protein
MKREKALETVLTIATGLMVLSFVFHTKWLVVAAIALGAVSLASKLLAGKVAWAWLKLAAGLGYVMSHVLMTILFFCVLVPVALLSRRGKDPLQLKKKSEGSYYFERDHRYEAKDFENIW